VPLFTLRDAKERFLGVGLTLRIFSSPITVPAVSFSGSSSAIGTSSVAVSASASAASSIGWATSGPGTWSASFLLPSFDFWHVVALNIHRFRAILRSLRLLDLTPDLIPRSHLANIHAICSPPTKKSNIFSNKNETTPQCTLHNFFVHSNEFLCYETLPLRVTISLQCLSA